MAVTERKTDLDRLRTGETLSLLQQLRMIIQLSVPAIFSQVSSIVMQYIDASMVGRLGAEASASIGLVSSSTWLMMGLCSAASVGFTVQIAHRIGAGEEQKARQIVRQGLLSVFVFALILSVAASSISGRLPLWLGAQQDVAGNAGRYFLVFALFLPVQQMNYTAGGMLQCSGNMKTPSILNILMCPLDIIFNFLLIFPAREMEIAGWMIRIPGAGLGVTGAALGTGLAQLCVCFLMLGALLVRSPLLHLRKGEKIHFSKTVLKTAVRIALPVGFEQVITCGAQVAQTRIVAPLGTVSIAANSFAVTAESLCYMPGFGVSTAATTIIGQSIGAGRRDLTKRLGWIVTLFGMAVMTFSGCCMFFAAPFMIGILSPDGAIRSLGAAVLRIEAFAEPLYAASMVASGVFRGAGDTLVPSVLNFASMWLVRIPLAAFLAPRMGLQGVWLAMCLELCVRGLLFLIRLWRAKLGGRSERGNL